MAVSKDLSKYRFEKAQECLLDAKMSLDAGRFDFAANRSYYCIFHCMRSVLALEEIDFKKHSAVIAHFRNNYVKTNKFNKRISNIISDLFELRDKSDYEDFFVISKKEVAEQVKNAEHFLQQIKIYLESI